ncbi:MAG: GTPase HflX [Phycisphaerae bacterium]|nr:GTPase HflX [Phycisphaerae bacterium]
MAEARTKVVSVAKERALLAAVLPPGAAHADPSGRDPLEELQSLAEAAGAVVVDQLIQHRARPVAGTLMGKGRVQDLADLAKAQEVEVVIFENDLTPAQIRNIENVVERKVIDRSELILDIFASRARSYEAKLQVELAQLEYTYPRLRAMWSHLERIVGGSPAGIGTRGPGEQQLEIDRRIVQRRKAELRREIREVQGRKQREVKQRNTDFFTVGLVGYTNAGKSTFFNTATGASVYADDRLFATLDTRTRRWDLGAGDSVMLSDTVGFIRHLPHHLVASFRATLEESMHSDLLLVIVDASDPDAPQQYQTVLDVLSELETDEQPQLLLLNKVDRLEDQAELVYWQKKYPDALPISAARGTGLDEVVERVREQQRGGLKQMTLRVPLSEGKAMTFLENRAEIHEREYDATFVTLKLTIGQRLLDQLRATGARFEQVQA